MKKIISALLIITAVFSATVVLIDIFYNKIVEDHKEVL